MYLSKMATGGKVGFLFFEFFDESGRYIGRKIGNDSGKLSTGQ